MELTARGLINAAITGLYIMAALPLLATPGTTRLFLTLMASYAATMFLVNYGRYLVYLASRTRAYIGECRVYDGLVLVCKGRMIPGVTALVFFRLIPTYSFAYASEKEIQQVINQVRSLYAVPQFGGLMVISSVDQPAYAKDVEAMLRQALSMQLLFSEKMRQMLKEELETLRRSTLTYGYLFAVAKVYARDPHQAVVTAKSIIPAVQGMFQVLHVKAEPVRMPELVDVLNALMFSKFYSITF